MTSFDAQTFISKELHNLLFLEEFVFAKTRFSPPASTEREFADAVVMLGDCLLIYQIKQRNLAKAREAAAERSWFKSKVVKQATKQVRDTLGYLSSRAEIRVPNERGHFFNLSSSSFSKIIKIVVHLGAPALPDDCRNHHYHISDTAGFIHIVDAQDYLEIAKTLRVPLEVIRYFEYREMMLTRFGSAAANVPEAAIAGHFVGGNLDELPTLSSVRYLHRLVQDTEKWDLAPFLRGLHDHLSVPEISDDYYDILIELAKLPRSAWRTAKERIVLCVEKVRKNEFSRPYRMVAPDTQCGFVFIPVESELVLQSDWAKIKIQAIQNFTQAHKYDQRLDKCIGIMVSKQGEWFHFDWCFIEHKWVEDKEMQRALDENFPFRPVREREVFGYFLTDE